MAPTSRPLPLGALPFFEAAARLGSFSAAARELNASQPAVSHQIARLEAELGVPLFVRGHRGAVPTVGGRRLLEAVQDGLATMAAAAEALRAARKPPSLTIATDFGLAALWLLPRLPGLRGLLPGVDVRILTAQRPVHPGADPVDVALPFGRGPWPGCRALRLFDEVVVPVCSPGFLAAHGPLARPADLAALPLLDLEAPEPDRWLSWADYLAADGASAAGSARHLGLNDYSLVVQAAVDGQGVALGWHPLIDDELARGRLVVAVDRPLRTDRGYVMIWPAGGQEAPAVTVLRRWLLREALGAAVDEPGRTNDAANAQPARCAPRGR